MVTPPLRITLLDARMMLGDELTLDPLRALGEVTAHDRTAPGDRVARCLDMDAVLTNKVVIDEPLLAACPRVKYVGVTATGVNVVDLDAARRHGVTVTNVPAYSGPSVAQHVFAMLLERVSHAAAHHQSVAAGGWVRSPDVMYTVKPITELSGKTLGVVGYGDTGQRVAAIGQAMGMAVLYHSRGRSNATLDELFAQSDVVTLHCPLTPQTKHLINPPRLAMMKRSALLINTGRGDLIDEAALAQALHTGQIAGACVDVLSTEPPRADNPLLTAPNCLITPHIAWASVEARTRLLAATAANLRAWLAGQPVNRVV